jgi:outer membrane protein OmpA-like peptidoglycan-associated protein
MIEPLDDALDALIRDVASPLAGNLGETVQATEWGLQTGVIELVEMLQRQSADSQFFDLVVELVDHYRRTNDDATAEAYFSPASIAAGSSLVEGVFGASRTNLAEEISRGASLQPHAAVCVLNVAAVLLLKALEPGVSQERLIETSSGSELSKDVSRRSPQQPSGEQEFMVAKSTNDEEPDRKKIRNAKLSWFLLAAATISIIGLAWRFGRDTHSSHETPSASIKEPSLSTESDAGGKPVPDMTPTQTREAPAAPKEEVTAMGLTEGTAKRAHEVVPLTPTPDSPSTPAKQPESPGLKEAESIMKPANNTGDIRADIVRAKLPNGVELNTSKSGVEGELLGFLEHGSQESGEFILDEISFVTGNKTLKSSSREQLKNLAKILKAYPNTEIVINGYTDNLGVKAHNLRLSRERASYVLQELARIGVDKSRMTSKGFGDDHPVASNSSEEGRTRNRRISIYVTRK